MATGQPTAALRETLAAFDGAGTPLSTTEVADALDLGRRSTYDRLERLVDHGRLETKKVGAKARVWWRPEPGPDAAVPDRPAAPGSDLRDVLDGAEVAVIVLDDECEVALINAAAERYFGLDRERVVGRDERTLVEERIAPRVDDPESFLEAVLATDDTDAERFECRVRPADGREERRLEHRSRPIESGAYAGGRVEIYDDVTERGHSPEAREDGDPAGYAQVTREVTDRRERELQRYETLFENSKDVNVVVDADGRFQYVTPSVSNVFGYEQEELIGDVGFEYIHPDDREEAMAEFAAALDDPDYEPRVEFRFRHGDGSWITIEALARNLLEDPDIRGIVVYTRDVTERKERERELERYETVVETMTDGVYVVDGDGRFRMANDAYVEMVDPSRDELIGAHVTDVVDEETAARAQRVERELRADERDQARLEAELPGPDGETIHAEATFGLLPTEDGAVERVGVVRDVTERKERESELLQQREQLSALNNLNGVVREITGAVVEQSTREEIEAAVCERLAGSDSYAFAWIGDADATSGIVNVRAQAGAAAYLEGVTVSIDPEDERSQGPTGQALRTGEIQVVADARTDPRHDPWRDQLEAAGIRSSAAIPIVHENTIYGALNVYSQRADAFADQERAVVSQLGEVVGHAIAAAERKRALLSDEVVEVEFLLAEVFDALDLDADGGGTIVFEESVPVGDGEYVVYGTATDDAAGDVEALTEAIRHWSDVTIREGSEEVRFEAHLSDPPVLSAIASLGGSIEDAVVEDGDYRVTIHLAPSVDVGNVVDAVQEAYPIAEMVARRQIDRPDDATEAVHRVLDEALTDRQDAALRAAYHAGFFEWPRELSGEDVAESLSISPPTFSQHLRKAERKVFDALLS